MDVISRFDRYYCGDELLRRIDINTLERTIVFGLCGASLLKDGDTPSIFDPEQRFAPAEVSFTNCREIRALEVDYALNRRSP